MVPRLLRSTNSTVGTVLGAQLAIQGHADHDPPIVPSIVFETICLIIFRIRKLFPLSQVSSDVAHMLRVELESGAL